MVAMGRVPGTSFTMLDLKWCTTCGDREPAPVVLHDSASRGVRKIGRWQRRLRRSVSCPDGRLNGREAARCPQLLTKVTLARQRRRWPRREGPGQQDRGPCCTGAPQRQRTGLWATLQG